MLNLQPHTAPDEIPAAGCFYYRSGFCYGQLIKGKVLDKDTKLPLTALW